MIEINGLTYPLSFWQKIKNVIVNPKEFFDLIQQEVEVKEVIIYYILLQLLILPLGIIASLLIGAGETAASTILMYGMGISLGAVVFFIILLIYNLIVSWFGGKQGYQRTFQAFIYGTTPGVLLSWIPIVNIIASIYSIYLTIVGLIKLQQMESSKAIWAYFLPLIILFAITLLGGILLFISRLA